MAAAVLGAALQLTASLAIAAGVVVCRTPSGHVAIESGLDRDCCGATVDHDLTASTCDGCTDTPFVQASVSPSSKAVLDVAVMSRGFVAPVPTWRVTVHTAPLRALDRSARDRSVVLLI